MRWLLGCVGVVVGCSASFTNVSVYADGLNETESRVGPIANDAYTTCLRRARYEFLSERLTLQDLPEAERIEETVATNATYDQDRRSCQRWAALGESFRAYHSMVLVYAEALSRIAKDESVDYGKAAKDLAAKTSDAALALAPARLKALQEKGFRDAGSNLAAVIARWASQHYKRDQVKEAVLEGGPRVARILEALRYTLGEVYLVRLDQEWKAASSLYEELGTKPYGAVADVQWQQLREQMAERRQAAVELRSRLEHLEEATDALVAAADDGRLEDERLLDEVQVVLADMLRVREEVRNVEWQPAGDPALELVPSSSPSAPPAPASAAPPTPAASAPPGSSNP